MIELLRNCSHESETATYLVTENTRNKRILKTASSLAGINSLEREIEGWEWYRHLRYPEGTRSVCRINQKRAGYLKIEIEFIEGVKADYKKGFEKNEAVIKKTMEHYCGIWPYNSDGSSAMHGDLSLDNIIYNAQGIHIIDWEHFSRKGAPWGFDAVYLLFETLYFGMNSRKQPSFRELNFIADCIILLGRSKHLKVDFIKCPLKAVRDFIQAFPALWGEHLSAAPRKLPVISFTDEQVFFMDQYLFSKTKVML